MKGSDQIKDWDFEQPWDSFLLAEHLCLNTFDFSDLWDEDDSGEEEGTHSANESTCPQGPLVPPNPPPPPLPPPPPPVAPALPSVSPKGATIKSRTLKLHWRELQNLAPLPRITRFGTQTIWAGLEPVHLDTNRLEYLFESKVNSTSFNVVSSRQVRLMRQDDTSEMHFMLYIYCNEQEISRFTKCILLIKSIIVFF